MFSPQYSPYFHPYVLNHQPYHIADQRQFVANHPYAEQEIMPHYRQLAPIDPNLFMNSSAAGIRLLADAHLIIQRIHTDRNFAAQLMTEAQQSNFDVVDQLIAAIGIQHKVKTWFNPEGIRFEIDSEDHTPEQSRLIISLKWKEFPHLV